MKTPLLIVDTETTSKYADQAAVVEIACLLVDLEDGSESTYFSSLANPGESALRAPGADEALRINGLTREEILAAPTSAEVAADFAAFRRLAGNPALAGYNTNKYDSVVLSRAPYSVPACDWAQDMDVMLKAWSAMSRLHPCPLEWMPGYKDRPGKYKWPRLEEAARFYGVLEHEQTHRALDDCRMTFRLLRRLIHE